MTDIGSSNGLQLLFLLRSKGSIFLVTSQKIMKALAPPFLRTLGPSRYEEKRYGEKYNFAGFNIHVTSANGI